ncbi:DsbA family protein [Micrococcus terreus]|uniref:DsbA family protein n=1 Tax=Micrococcus terreus TaxID=574650 RepID=UPI0025505463|nr:thioredoxin domain-containing protein [Micrococcus terreus]MDK7701728.1 thioredoxin domain-containing protein [Micrococcus terreus]WOO97525.1 thioredoxin domain-containing protein [Micrococcus terreus]
MASSSKQTKAERQESAREKARQMQEQQRRQEKRRSQMIRWGVVIGVVAAIALVVGIITMNSSRAIPDAGPAPTAGNVHGGVTAVSSTELAPGDVPGGQVDAAAVGEPSGTAETVTTVPGAEQKPAGEPAQIIVYADANCVHCAGFEETHGAKLQEWLDAGEVTVEYRLVGYLDSSATSNYSSRAANAALCVAEDSPEQYVPFLNQMFAAYTGQGISDDELTNMASGLGADINSCVDDNTYRPFVKYTTAKAQEAQIPGTPSVWVQGQRWDGNADPDFQVWAQGLIDGGSAESEGEAQG